MADGLAPKTYQHLVQLGLSRLVDASGGNPGPHSVVAYHLIPTNGYHNGQRLPHDVYEDLKGQGYEQKVLDGIEYYLVPEVSTNLPGTLSHYAQRTGVAELQNPPSGGVNRVRETLVNYSEATAAPDDVAKYVAENDAWEEARKKASAQDEQVADAVTKSPAREPAEGKLEVSSDSSSDSESSPRRGRPPKSTDDSTPTEG